ncbi:MATE family efflux transporter [Clostridium septicum]|uniref:Probable multidrug resistance protein NorM n=1 Tax=Clostridium septicum TaxID=1504 RepID=A0A9N7JKF9_CLOSE|nr:MATE family efflux transporter [Clostridium septicum]AYE33501.1 MATE family efflux transporter [Clostridium septicum]MDU1315302.1 MATE family efflux transporter [Clostridium septicum]QAS61670.1 MATE family efflux transporter [Clostridium septicum]UEC21890.1 MATE family efflux transporter [Clostridium septicum]USS00079.1 MATE family efflux transporter [Clostridium septicum]
MKSKVDLISDNIFKTLIKLSLPILGTSFIQMAYNMIDMLWIGRVGSDAVAAVGTAGFFTWFGSALVFISKVGAEIGVSQSIGKDNLKEKNKFVYNSLLINIITALIYTVTLIIFRKQLIGFFNLGDINIINMSIDYLVIVSIGMIFMFLNPLFTGIFNASGNSKTPFIINTIGLVFNIVFDPILIFGMGGFPELGVKGAALATVFAQVIVAIIFIIEFIKNGYSLSLNNKKYIDKLYIFRICKLGLPAALQNGLFSIFAMLIGKIIAGWGPVSIAVQKVGSQIEAISWMTAGGFSTALTSFIGQNYGANKWDRIIKGYKATMIMAIIVGIFATVLLVFFGEQVFSWFIKEADAIEQGKVYLKILGYSQLFMCLEITTAGAFSGLGNTITPSWISIIFTGFRVPLSIILSNIDFLGINGIWWSISGTSMIKGVLIIILFMLMVLIPNKKKIKMC